VLFHRVPMAKLPTDVDVVLITHEHEDHFDETALATIDKRATIVVPKWLEQRTRALGFTDVVTCVAGASLAHVRGLAIDVAEARHDVIEVTYRCERAGKSIFLGGDTLPTKSIQDLAAKKPVDFAILPADGGELLGTRWVMNPAEARNMAFRFGVTDDVKKGALLTHHECVVHAPWNLIVHIDPPDPRDFPHWYRVPTPGEFIPFPWSTA
jgi:L-ascorbate metabolism protein UlaG (beta-lactamase superfamily)